MKSLEFSCIILAGGKSSRMGTDKALLQFNGQPLLSIICETVQDLAIETYIITPWTKKYQQIVPAGCQLIRELSPDNGPLVAFAQGLRQVKTEWVLLLACDLVYLDQEAIAKWSKLLEQTPGSAIALLPKHPTKGWEVLSGFYRHSCLNLIEKFIICGGRSLQKWLLTQEVVELPVSNPQVLFNCNTPEDWQYYVQTRINRRW